MSHCVMRYRFIRCQFCNGNGPYVRIHIFFFEFISHKNLSLYKVTESVHYLRKRLPSCLWGKINRKIFYKCNKSLDVLEIIYCRQIEIVTSGDWYD